MKKYSKETYRLRELEEALHIPLVSDFKDKACNLLTEFYPNEIEAYFNYKSINREYKSFLNQLKKKYDRKVISMCSSGVFKDKQQELEYNHYIELLNKRRTFNDAYKFIKPRVDSLALKLYKNHKSFQKGIESPELKEFLALLKGLVIYTVKVFYNQPTLDEDFIEGMYQSCYLAYLLNYDRTFKKVDTFFVTHIINELSHINTKEIPVDDFSKLDSSKESSTCVVINKFDNRLDRHLTWEISKYVL